MLKENDAEKYKNEPVHLYCDTVNIVTSQEAFLFAVRSGGALNAYLLTPAHTKRLLLALQDQMEKYEAAYGEVKAALAPKPMLSPLQQPDLGAGGKEKEG